MELKPCPFCGSDRIYKVNDGHSNSLVAIHKITEWAVGCSICRIPESLSHISEEDAIKAWNKRDEAQS